MRGARQVDSIITDALVALSERHQGRNIFSGILSPDVYVFISVVMTVTTFNF